MLFVPAVPIRRGTSLINTLRNLGLTSNLQVCLDAGDLNSYDGSSQTWKDLSGNGYDFYRGSGSGSDGADPTFNGTAGRQSSGEYFSCDGGDYFTLAQTNPAWVQTLHKTGAKFTIAELVYVNGAVDLTKNFGVIGDGDASTGTNGFGFASSASTLRAMAVAISNATVTVYGKKSTAIANNNAWNFLAVSVDMTAGNVIFNINGTVETYSSQTFTGTPISGNAGSALQIGAGGGATLPDSAGVRWNAVAILDAALSSANLLSLYGFAKQRLGI